MRGIIALSLLLCLAACGPKSIPYSDSTDAPEPSDVAKSHYNWGMEAAQSGDVTQAIIELKLAIQHEPRWAMPYFSLGVVYGNQGELEQAIPAWERATQLDAGFAKAHYNLAVAYSVQKQKVLSIASLREAARLDKAALSAAKAEPGFDNIRDMPAYQELVQATQAN